MKINKLSTLLLISICAINTYAQDYFVVNKDTTYCTNLTYETTAQGYLKSIEYVDANGETVSIEGKKKVPDVITFYQNGVLIDKTPLKANKPDSYIRYTQRAVDGKLKVYLAQQGYDSSLKYTPGSPSGDFSTGGPTGSYRFFLKMPNGTFYKINSKGNMKKYIKPYLLKCKDFKNQYDGDFSTKEEPFMEMINLYNSLCD